MGLATTIRTHLSTVETLTGDDVPAGSQVQHTGYDRTAGPLDPTTTPDVTAAAYQDVPLSGGAATVDLTAVLLNGLPVNLSGLKPRALLLYNPGPNPMLVATGGTNGYTVGGHAISVPIPAGGSAALNFSGAGAADAVAGGKKTLDVTGTGSDVLRLGVAAGPT